MIRNSIISITLVSLIFAIFVPFLGFIPLFFSIQALHQFLIDEDYKMQLFKSLKWLKICGITFVVSYATVLIIFGFILYQNNL